MVQSLSIRERSKFDYSNSSDYIPTWPATQLVRRIANAIEITGPLANDRSKNDEAGLDVGVGCLCVLGGCPTLGRPYGRWRLARLGVVDPDERPVFVELGRIGIVVVAETVRRVRVQRLLVAFEGLAALAQFRRPQRRVPVR